MAAKTEAADRYAIVRGVLFYRPYSVDEGNWTCAVGSARTWRTQRGAQKLADRLATLRKGETVRVVLLSKLSDER